MSVRIAYFVAFLDQPHRHAGDGGPHRHAGVHQRQRAAAHRRHRRRAVRLEDVGDDADRVRELLERRQHALQRPLGQGAVADLAAAGAAHRSHFAGGERREVVVQHERLRRLAGLVDAVEPLHVVRRAERGRDERLRLAAREQRRAVRARQEPGLDRDRADSFGVAAVDALARLEHLRAERCCTRCPRAALRCPSRCPGTPSSSCSATSFFTRSTASMRVCLSFWLIASPILPFGQLLHARRRARRAISALRPLHLLGAAGLGEQLFLRSRSAPRCPAGRP